MIIFSKKNLRKEIADYANEKIFQPKGLTLLAFQFSEGKLFIVYEGR